MTSAQITEHRFTAPDGAGLVWREIGVGRSVLLLHGLFSDGTINWLRYGHAKLLAENGFRVVMPDLRSHGLSEKSHALLSYTNDILVDDGLALIGHLGLTDYDLGGYSLGARTAVRMVVRGAAPRRLIVSGMGLTGLTTTAPRTDYFKYILDNLGRFEKFTPEWNAESFLRTTRGDPVALRLLLDTFLDTSREDIAAIVMPTLILSGADDSDNGSVEGLAALLPDATLVRTPGGHMSAVTKPELGQAIAAFLTA